MVITEIQLKENISYLSSEVSQNPGYKTSKLSCNHLIK